MAKKIQDPIKLPERLKWEQHSNKIEQLMALVFDVSPDGGQKDHWLKSTYSGIKVDILTKKQTGYSSYFGVGKDQGPEVIGIVIIGDGLEYKSIRRKVMAKDNAISKSELEEKFNEVLKLHNAAKVTKVEIETDEQRRSQLVQNIFKATGVEVSESTWDRNKSKDESVFLDINPNNHATLTLLKLSPGTAAKVLTYLQSIK